LRLQSSFNFERSLIEQVACRDEIDREILRLLFEVGSFGLLPKDLAVKLSEFRVTRHQVSRRILRMNRCEKELGEHLAEQRGWHWALTSFAVEFWGDNGGRTLNSFERDSLLNQAPATRNKVL